MEIDSLDDFFTELDCRLKDRRLTPSDFETFFDALDYRLDVFCSAKRQMDRYVASDFSVFSYIWPDENRLSDVLRDLLDPRGSHGQGDTFLAAFLRCIACERCYQPGDSVTVEREFGTDRIYRTQRRLDLLIRINRDQGPVEAIAIENKPWAADQENQVDDYLEHLKRCFPEGGYRIVYLTRSGEPPSRNSARDPEGLRQQGLLRLMPYVTPRSGQPCLMDWLTTCHSVCEAEKIRWFLRDLMEYLRANLHYTES